MELNNFYRYKDRFIGDLLTDQTILNLLDDDCESTPTPPQKYVGTQVFPFEYIPDTVEHATTFICCDVEIRRSIDDMRMEQNILVWIFTHKSKLLLPEGGVRPDAIACRIWELLDGSRKYGLGELRGVSARPFSPTMDYLGKQLVFRAVEINRFSPSGKVIPANRKEGY